MCLISKELTFVPLATYDREAKQKELADLITVAAGTSKNIALVTLSHYHVELFKNFLHFANLSALAPILILAEDVLAYDMAQASGFHAFLVPQSSYCSSVNQNPLLTVAADTLTLRYNILLLNALVVLNNTNMWEYFEKATPDADAIFFENSWMMESEKNNISTIDTEVFFMRSSNRLLLFAFFSFSLSYFFSSER